MNLTINERSSILLHPRSHLTTLIAQYFHEKLPHPGVSSTLTEIGRTYWIPKGRSLLKKLIKNCLVRHKYQSRHYNLPRMPPLSNVRNIRIKPFQITDLDYLGPILIKNDIFKINMKVWICLFTCITIRVLHSEAVFNLTSQTFLNAYKRFIARRGKPTRIISDNATTFKGGKQGLDEAWSLIRKNKDSLNYFTNEKIQCDFITEYAP